MAVVPGWIGLERARLEWQGLTPDERHRLGPLIPPEDIARIVVSLLSDGRSGAIVDIPYGEVSP